MSITADLCCDDYRCRQIGDVNKSWQKLISVNPNVSKLFII